MGKRSSRMYKDSPKMSRGESGKMEVKKPTKAEKVESGTEGVLSEDAQEGALPPHIRHASDRSDMHKRHEHEHMMHDHAGNGDKKDMHERHHAEMKALHKMHEKEHGKGEAGKEKAGKQEAPKKEGADAKKTGEKKIEKIKDKKED